MLLQQLLYLSRLVDCVSREQEVSVLCFLKSQQTYLCLVRRKFGRIVIILWVVLKQDHPEPMHFTSGKRELVIW